MTNQITAMHPYANVGINSDALRIRMLREMVGLSRPKFAEALGVPQTTLKNYELGYRSVGWDFVRAAIHHPGIGSMARALLVDTPPFTATGGFNDNGDPLYTLPSVTGCTEYSPEYVLRYYADRLLESGSYSELPAEFHGRWLNRRYKLAELSA